MNIFYEKFADRIRVDENGCHLWQGWLNEYGYSRFRSDGQRGYGHRIAYQMVKGEIPAGMEIDHACQQRACVNPDHLRLATRAQNIAHQRLQARNTSGVRGVSWHKQAQKWVARVRVDGRTINLGVFADKAEAAKVAAETRARYFGEFSGDAA